MAPTTTPPAHWEADVLLSDGRPARLRPLQPGDADILVDFWSRLSAQSQYFRFFAPHDHLTEVDVHRLVEPDHRKRVSLGIFLGASLIGIGEFGIIPDAGAGELGLTVLDEYHGFGVGGLLLEHLAQIARELGLTRLTAEVLAENRKMAKTMATAGYALGTSLSGGVLHFHAALEPTDVSLAVMEGREHRADANSMRRIFQARTVAVVGGSARRPSVGRRLVSNVIASEFTGRLYVVNPGAESAFGMRAYPSLRDLPEPVDLAVIAVPAERVPEVVADCAATQVHAVIVVSLGYAEAGEEGRRRQAELLDQCRQAGIRLLGPCALGLVNPVGNALNASMCDVWPKPGPIGFFCQSGPLSLTALRMLVDRGLGVSSFVSAGNRADVSGNDLLQYWEQDEHTQVILCYLETLGNVNKLARLARRVSARKPVVALTSWSGGYGLRQPNAQGSVGQAVPPAVVDAMLRQAGVIRVDHVEHLFDVAQLLIHQPPPRGRRLAIVGNSPEPTIIAANAAEEAGFETRVTWLGQAAPPIAYDERLRAAMADDDVDAVLAVVVQAPVQTGDEMRQYRTSIAGLGAHPTKPLLAVIPRAEEEEGLLREPRLAQGVYAAPRDVDPAGVDAVSPRDVDPAGVDAVAPAGVDPDAGGRAVPLYHSPERAVLALRKVSGYARWRGTADSPVPLLPGVAHDEAAELVADVLRRTPQGRRLADHEVTELLGCYGIPLLDYRSVDSLEAAVEAADALGWDAVLKATNTAAGEAWSQRLWRQIRDEQQMSVAWEQLTENVGDPRVAEVVVQRTGLPGLHVRVSGTEHALLGPMVSCRIAGVAAEVLQDVSYRLPPLTRADATAMVRELRLAPLLLGGAGIPPTDVAAVEDLISRIAQLKQKQPDVADLDLDVLVHVEGISVVCAWAWVHPAEPRYALNARRLSAPTDGL